jgi:hypothetical protein
MAQNKNASTRVIASYEEQSAQMAVASCQQITKTISGVGNNTCEQTD